MSLKTSLLPCSISKINILLLTGFRSSSDGSMTTPGPPDPGVGLAAAYPSVTLPAIQHRRKFSLGASLHSNLLSGGFGNSAPEFNARRRFSNVSDVVSRKLSNTIGWRTNTVPTAEILEQGKSLCGQYVRARLKRSGVFSRKCGLNRIRNVHVREVFPRLQAIGHELERMHPNLYVGIARQASATPMLGSEKHVAEILITVARELLKLEVTWARVISLFAVAGGLAVDCVRQGHPEYITALVEAFTEILDEELASWVANNGGWVS